MGLNYRSPPGERAVYSYSQCSGQRIAYMATAQCGGPPTRATHVTMPARLLRGDVLQCGAGGAGARGRRGA